MIQAVILARGLGSRMRQADPGAALLPEQEAAAATGAKGMIPVGRPFLDYLLSALADAGFREACLVIGPEHQATREYYETPGRVKRIGVSFCVQEKPLGTADAVLAAEAGAGHGHFLVCNSDNYYPVPALAALRELGAEGLAGFDAEALVRLGNIPAERVSQFALIRETPDGFLSEIVEKPDPATAASFGPHARVSMNAWVFDPTIFEACRRTTPSARGELEIQDAVRLAMRELGSRFRVLPVAAGVLDLSRRGDVAEVARRLAGIEVRL
jgi:glucose-1-phosphate thymidylyltransferase